MNFTLSGAAWKRFGIIYKRKEDIDDDEGIEVEVLKHEMQTYFSEFKEDYSSMLDGMNPSDQGKKLMTEFDIYLKYQSNDISEHLMKTRGPTYKWNDTRKTSKKGVPDDRSISIGGLADALKKSSLGHKKAAAPVASKGGNAPHRKAKAAAAAADDGPDLFAEGNY